MKTVNPFPAAALGACATIALLLGACQPAPAPDTTDSSASAPAADAAATPPPSHTFGPDISTEDLTQHIQTLASDEFEGRAPGTRGETLTVDYLVGQFKRLGLKPGNGDSYTQNVPMVETEVDPTTTLTLVGSDGTHTLAFGSEMVIGTTTGQTEVKVIGSEMVFLGYGVKAAENDWDDYATDVKGKTVVVLVNDPGFHVGDESLFLGKRMTYYGRWSYKYEEAARQGAAALLIVHDTEGAGYGWDVVKNGWSGPQFNLPASEDPGPRLPVEGWLTADAANALFSRAGLDFDALRMAASSRDFSPVALNTTMSVTVKSSIKSGESKNVLAILPGSDHPDEAVIYMAHWDHLGRDPTLTGDQIYNGASDNATGVAGVLEIAELFVTQEPAPKRSLLFAAVTLEESGLLGSKYYVAHPSIPLENTVGVINMDNMPSLGRTRDFTVIGFGNSELEDILRPIAERQSRVLRPESAPEKGFFYRSDHFNFAKAGVPALYAKAGADLFEKGEVEGLARQAEYIAERYHKPGDEYDASWDLTGMVEDLLALYRVGKVLTDGDQWPNWYEGNEFRAARDAQRPPTPAPAPAPASP